MDVSISRRAFISGLVRVVAATPLLAAAQGSLAKIASSGDLAESKNAKTLAFEHTHTGEKLSITYALGDDYVPASLKSFNLFLRDHYTGAVGRMDPELLDLLYGLKQECGTDEPFQVISGYRCPSTNRKLRRRSRGVARNSLHMQGRAIDIRLPDVKLADLKDAARDLRRGGVGFYPSRGFVHVDTGDVRFWQGGRAI
jgi:uncharacterized protein YcbK (DUF882 family)